MSSYKRIASIRLGYYEQFRLSRTRHIHLIVGITKDSLSDMIRDFKKYTSKKIYEAIKSIPEKAEKVVALALEKRR